MKWEYQKLLLTMLDDEDVMNELGEEGWELVTLIRDPEDDLLNAYFKRPKE